jgi:hypothetical protein
MVVVTDSQRLKVPNGVAGHHKRGIVVRAQKCAERVRFVVIDFHHPVGQATRHGEIVEFP